MKMKGGKNISNQPIIFNITYTPWKLKSNATPEERKKFERERPYYEMRDGGNNIYKYMTADRKLNGENSKSEMRDMISYFEKSTGVFNGDGFISQEELKAIQQRAKADKILWHGFISLNEEMSRKIDMPEKCMRLVKRTFGEFFRDMRLDPKNIDLICSLHKDKPHHLHIHFWFAEKEPKCKYRKKELEYRHKGKIEKAVIDRMHVRLNAFIDERTDKMYMTRDEALRELKRITFPKSIVSEDEVRKELIALAKAIPKDASFFYSKKDMLPYREHIDKTVNQLMLFDKRARKRKWRQNANIKKSRKREQVDTTTVSALEQIVLQDIRKVCAYVRAYEQEFLEDFRKCSVKESARLQSAAKSELKKAESRLSEIEKIIVKLYEEKVCGRIPEERFELLAKNYETEQAELKQKTEALKASLIAAKETDSSLAKFISLVRSYTEVKELTPEILNSFIDKIYIGKPERIDGKRVQEVKIVYKLIGAVNIPQ